MVNIEQYGIKPYGAIPNERQIDHFHLSKKAFFHFGVNTFSNREHGLGNESAEIFNPTQTDVRQWIRTVKAAGFRLAILTVKHHDGFCLWPSRYSDFTVKNTPYKNGDGDIVREFSDACREYGIKMGIYISPWDRNSKYWGTDGYNDYFCNQLTELLTGYGRIDEVWWDGCGSRDAVYDWGRWAFIVREHQPTAAIFGAMGAAKYVDLRWVGNERGFAGETHYACIDKKYIEIETGDELNRGMAGGTDYIPSETDVSIRPGWFYHKEQDGLVKSVYHLNKIWFESVGRNSMMLLNFPPDRRGLVYETDANNAILSHRCISKMLAVNYAVGADITSSSTLSPELSADKAVWDGDEYFFASAENAVRIDIVLKQKTLLNVFAFGELIEAGERITAFKIEDMTRGVPELIYDGTSVGFYRAVKIPSREYGHIRLTITKAFAPPVLRTIGLHLFEDADDESVATAKTQDLAKLSTTQIEYSDDLKSAVVAFGGIFPFNHVEFTLCGASSYSVEAFDGVRYRTHAKGKTEDGSVSIDLEHSALGSYQMRIKADTEIDRNAPISIRFVD